MDTTENTNLNCDTITGICTTEQTISNDVKKIETITTKKKPKLIYFYDALCGWCYGFSAVIQEIGTIYKDKLDIELISGGLFLGTRTGFINDVAPYIKAGAYKSVEQTTGVKFGAAFLSKLFGDGKIVLNSILPSMALCIVKEKYPDRQLEFGELLLNAFYHDGLSADDVDGLAQYAVSIGFDNNEFLEKIKQPKYKDMAEKEFQVFKQSYCNGMPSLVLEIDKNQHILSSGYANVHQLRNRLDELLKENEL